MNPTDTLNLLIQSYNVGQSPTSYLSTECISSIVTCDSDDIRQWLAKALINHKSNSFAVPLLCQLAQDSQSYVRVEAVDTLGSFICQESFNALCLAVNDDDELVRTYAAFGIAAVGKEIAPTKALYLLNQVALLEESRRVLVDVYGGMHLLGQHDALQKLFELFQVDDYHVQCAVIHFLEDIINNDNRDEIAHFINSLNISSYVYAVIDAILQIKQKIGGTGDGLCEP